MTNRIYSFLGLAVKANKLISGEAGCEKSIKFKSVELVIVACDASDNTKKKFTNMCNYRNIAMRFFGEKELLGKYLGKKVLSVAVIIDKGFAKRLIEMMDETNIACGGEFIGQNESL